MNLVARFLTNLALCGLVLSLAPAQAQSPAIDSGKKQEVTEALANTLKENAYVPGVDFTLIDEYLKRNERKIAQANTEESFRQCIADALKNFGFSHIVLFSPRMVQQRRENKAVGIGIYSNPTKDGVVINRVFPNSPAAEAGLQAGDTLVEADGKKIESLTQILGTEGSKVTFKIIKFDGMKTELTLTRRKYSTVILPKLAWQDKETAILSVPTFDQTYDRLLIEGYVKQAIGAKNLILDLRNNPGGAVINLVHLLGIVLPPETPIGSFVTKRMVAEYKETFPKTSFDPVSVANWNPAKIKSPKRSRIHFDGKIAVLINSGSGSASEIAAAALRENLGAPIFGKRSAGAVLVSVMGTLPHNYMIQYPITDYVSNKGLRIEGKGVIPDADVEDPRYERTGVADEVILKAVAYFNKSNQ